MQKSIFSMKKLKYLGKLKNAEKNISHCWFEGALGGAAAPNSCGIKMQKLKSAFFENIHQINIKISRRNIKISQENNRPLSLTHTTCLFLDSYHTPLSLLHWDFTNHLPLTMFAAETAISSVLLSRAMTTDTFHKPSTIKCPDRRRAALVRSHEKKI